MKFYVKFADSEAEQIIASALANRRSPQDEIAILALRALRSRVRKSPPPAKREQYQTQEAGR